MAPKRKNNSDQSQRAKRTAKESNYETTGDVTHVDATFRPLIQDTENYADSDDWLSWLDGLKKKCTDAEFTEIIRRSRQHALDSGEFSDVTLKCGDSEIACHRLILAESSPVFKAMFTTDMAESQPGNRSVVVHDVESQVLRKVIGFLYTGKIEITGADFLQILQFADMYQIDHLRKVHENIMLKNISISSVASIFVTAQKYQVKHACETARGFINENFYSDGNKSVAFSKGFLELEKDDLMTILTDPHLVAPSENQVFEVLWTWLTHKQERMALLSSELLESCLHVPLLDANYVMRYIHTEQTSPLSDDVSSLLFPFLKMIVTKHRASIGTLLPVRLKTKQVQFLTLVLHTYRSPKFLLMVPRSDSSIKADTIVFQPKTSESSHRTPVERLINNAQPISATPYVKARCNIMRKETELIVNPTELSGTSTFKAVSPLSAILYTNCFYATNSICASRNPRQLLALSTPRLSTTVYAHMYDLDSSTYQQQQASFAADRLYPTQDGLVFAFKQRDETSQNMTIRRLQSEKHWETMWKSIYDIDISSFNLMASYQNFILIFEPEKQRTIIFNSDTRDINMRRLSTRCDGTNTCIASVANVAFLVQADVIEVVYMDRLIQQHGKRNSSRSQQPEIIQNDAASQEPIITLNEAASQKPMVTLGDAASQKLMVTLNDTASQKPVVTLNDVASQKPVVTLGDAASQKLVVTLNDAASQKPVVTLNDAASQKPVSLACYPKMPISPTSQLKACVVFGDNLLVLLKSKGSLSEASSVSWKTTNVNTLLKQRGCFEWKTMTLQYCNASERVLQENWFKAELFNNVTETTAEND